MKISEIIVIVLLIYNLITFLLMGIDKFIAIKGKRRISEATLIVSALYTWRHRCISWNAGISSQN